MLKLMTIAFGGAIGALLRFGLYNITNHYAKTIFPVATLVVNLSGTFVVGFLWGIFEKHPAPNELKVFLFVGVLSSYTTFSTFYLDNLRLIKNDEPYLFFLNIILNTVLSLIFVFLGYYLSRLFAH